MMETSLDVSTFVPDSWLSRILDAIGAVMLFVLKQAHKDFKAQIDDITSLKGKHELLKDQLDHLTDTVQEIKQDVRESNSDIKKLLMRR